MAIHNAQRWDSVLLQCMWKDFSLFAFSLTCITLWYKRLQSSLDYYISKLPTARMITIILSTSEKVKFVAKSPPEKANFDAKIPYHLIWNAKEFKLKPCSKPKFNPVALCADIASFLCSAGFSGRGYKPLSRCWRTPWRCTLSRSRRPGTIFRPWQSTRKLRCLATNWNKTWRGLVS